jgi:hypothetical protein
MLGCDRRDRQLVGKPRMPYYTFGPPYRHDPGDTSSGRPKDLEGTCDQRM